MTKEPETTVGPSHWHALAAPEVLQLVQTDADLGLGREEATRRLAEHGPNALPEAKHRSLLSVFLRQFASPLIYILFVAAVIAFAMGHRNDSVVILIVVIINAVIGTVQEGRAERSMEALRRLSALKVRVLRGGDEETIEAHTLVPGDLVLLSAGDAVGADARLLEAAALESAEAALTGESLPVAKHPEPLSEDTSLADRRNMVYSGTHIAAGRGKAVVVATGLATEVGKIARLTAGAADPRTPLELRIYQFGRYLVGAASGLFAIIIAFGLLRGLPFGEILMVAISQMVSMVPEGLPVAMTIALAVGMQRMAKRGAIVRRLAAVETLGSTSVICSDKTGTLTKNEMTVTTLWLPGARQIEITGAGYSPEGKLLDAGNETTCKDDAALRALLEAVALCNDAQLVRPDDGDPRWRALGDPTEAALLTLAIKGCVELDLLRQQMPRRAEIPFNSAAKMMATQHGHGPRGRVFIKGAPEVVLDLCSTARQNDQREPVDESFRRDVEAASSAMGARALRLLAVAEVDDWGLEEGVGFAPFKGRATFLGLIGQMDPPRDEVKAAVAECRDAGIRPVMVTGDHKITGLAIARTLGIARDGDLAVDGRELELMPEQDLRTSLDRISVFARVHPAQKLRIVEAFQSQNKVVAMTGDGVNDAPALASADVGVAMGITGTEVAKGAAKIVITDDNFATIVNAVQEGRLVYRNLKKVILYLFATSMAEVLVLLSALFLGYPLPLAAVQILWINIVTEGTVTVNLIMEPPEGDEMKRPPIRQDEPLLNRTMLKRVALMTPVMALSAFGYYVWRTSTGAPFELVRSETFTVLAVCQWFNVLNCRSELKSALNFSLFKNYWLLGGLALGNVLHFLVIYTEPMNRIFHTVPIPMTDFFLIGAVASLVLWVEEIRKFFARRRARKAGTIS
ncbi:MAG: HAD-IC family P-type ATPase [Verrucomicrobiales bacterium]|nr:HAD-IC family P-type ATPase [Verrucomicrobiales bacterium]